MRTICRPSITTNTAESIGDGLITSSSNLAYPAANEAYFVPFSIERPIVTRRLFSMNGSGVSGNIDMGIYSRDGSRLISMGSVVHSGTSVPQLFDIGDKYFSPNQYYMAIAMDNNVGALRRMNVPLARSYLAGVLRATGSFPLPEKVIFTNVAISFIPVIGIELLGIL